MILLDIPTNDSCADTFTKPLGRQLFYRHFDTITGRRIPAYVFGKLPHPTQSNNYSTLACSVDSRSKEHGGYHGVYVTIRRSHFLQVYLTTTLYVGHTYVGLVPVSVHSAAQRMETRFQLIFSDMLLYSTYLTGNTAALSPTIDDR